MCKRRNQNSTKDLKQQLIKKVEPIKNRDYQGKNFEKKNTTGGEFNSI